MKAIVLLILAALVYPVRCWSQSAHLGQDRATVRAAILRDYPGAIEDVRNDTTGMLVFSHAKIDIYDGGVCVYFDSTGHVKDLLWDIDARDDLNARIAYNMVDIHASKLFSTFMDEVGESYDDFQETERRNENEEAHIVKMNHDVRFDIMTPEAASAGRNAAHEAIYGKPKAKRGKKK